ncbi:Alpha/Beta hydrolase protein [Aspergillus pseudoustus]|uniref:Alpha/Beta hydrolase protein n=1 Tax=Aspergillus pseudoustus TaxID=1810923 RepID=A0ABR4JQ44_9EURO
MLAFISLAALASAAACTPTYNSRPTAIIDSGAIVGTTTQIAVASATATVNKYLGIPFAEKPERFRLPKPVKPWHDFFDASQYGPACYQQISDTTAQFYEGVGLGVVPNGESEDCLNLNVYTPSTASAASKAVLVWIYGGSWQNGANSLPLYDGSKVVANQDVVLVSINYRTNVFGFPADESISLDERNLALHDTRLALGWVQRNIAYLGGDPRRVTIVGESGGSSTVDTLLTAPPDPLPFQAAIMTSSQISVPTSPQSPPAYIAAWKALAELAGCRDVEAVFDCLSDYPAQELVDLVTNNSISFNGFPDGGVTWADNPRLDRLAGKTARVPVLIGTTADEASPFVIGLNDTRAALESINLGEYADLIIEAYPLGTPGILTENARINRIATEFLMQCNTQVHANDTKRAGLDSWRFYFNASFPNTEFLPGLGAYHASEVAFFFGTYRTEGATAFQAKVSNALQTAYADFAKDPTVGPGWNQVPTIGVFGDGVRPGIDESGLEALTTIPSEILDVRCPLYYPVYDQNSLIPWEEQLAAQNGTEPSTDSGIPF